MAIDPPSDIVLEVARAADPTRAAAVAQRLNGLAANVNATGEDFGAALDQASPTKAASVVEGAPDMRARFASIQLGGNDKASKAQVQFESVLLNSLVSEMLPKDAPQAYGQGLAGEMWRSLLAEKISGEIAGSGALGIGRRLFATHPLSASAALMGAARASDNARADTAQMSANALSMASGADVSEGAFLFPAAKPL
jgi:Rod binding domain-containing protein